MESSWVRVIAVIGGFALAGGLAVDVIFRDTISPEIALAYITFDKIKSISEALTKFLAFNETWYRPFTFYLTSHILFDVVDVHDLVAIKTISFGLIVINAIVATLLARRVFESGVVECVLIFSLILTHPLYYSIAYEGSGISDPFFTIFLNLFLIGYLTLLESGSNRLGHVVRLGFTQAWLIGLSCCMLMVATVTSQERGLAIFPMVAALFIYYGWPMPAERRFRWSLPTLAVLAFAVAIGGLYLVFVYANKPKWEGDHYRTGIELKYILANLLKAVEFPSRLLLSQTAAAYDAHRTVLFNLFAAPLLACLLAYVVQVCRGSDVREKRRLIVLSILIVASLPIPVLFGSAPWHFYTAAIYLGIVSGRAVSFWLPAANRLLRAATLVGFFALLSIATARGIDQELAPDRDFVRYMSLVPLALKNKVLTDVGPVVPEVVYYDTGSWGAFTWPFGGQGNLFKYLYRNPGIVEIALENGKVLPADQRLCALAAGKPALSFRFDAEKLSWSPSDVKPCSP